MSDRSGGGPGGRGELFDRETLLDRLGGDRGVLEAVLRVFLEDVPLQLERLTAAVGASDPEAIRLGAHGLKGAAANITAESLRRAALALERAGARGDIGAISGLLDAVRREVELLYPVLESALITDR